MLPNTTQRRPQRPSEGKNTPQHLPSREKIEFSCKTTLHKICLEFSRPIFARFFYHSLVISHRKHSLRGGMFCYGVVHKLLICFCPKFNPKLYGPKNDANYDRQKPNILCQKRKTIKKRFRICGPSFVSASHVPAHPNLAIRLAREAAAKNLQIDPQIK